MPLPRRHRSLRALLPPFFFLLLPSMFHFASVDMHQQSDVAACRFPSAASVAAPFFFRRYASA